MSRIFQTRYFSRWLRKTELKEHDLYKAVQEMEQGLIDADLGGCVVKKRIGLAGRGKRSGARTLVATNKDNRWFSSLDSKKMNEPISAMKKKRLYKHSPKICCHAQHTSLITLF